jgi:hypothetical protein
MSTQEIAIGLVELCKQGRFNEAGDKYWAEEVTSIEPMPGTMHEMHGKQAVRGKGEWWTKNNKVHSVEVDGPYVNGDQFVVHYKMEVTPNNGARQTMDEVGVYTVQNDKITEERFFAC